MRKIFKLLIGVLFIALIIYVPNIYFNNKYIEPEIKTINAKQIDKLSVAKIINIKYHETGNIKKIISDVHQIAEIIATVSLAYLNGVIPSYSEAEYDLEIVDIEGEIIDIMGVLYATGYIRFESEGINYYLPQNDYDYLLELINR